MDIYKRYFKRIFDLVISIIGLIVLIPIILTLIFLLFFANHGKIFFFQERPGFKGLPFKIIKFKTMKDIFDIENQQLPDDKRVTKIGKLIRSTSLDEILQLINVIKGDMSLVGPRPLMMQYLKHYSQEQSRRHNVKPGITGFAQVNGRNAISWEQKFQYDVKYVDNISFALDVKILWLTLLKVLQRKGISADGHVPMEEFKGSNKNITQS